VGRTLSCPPLLTYVLVTPMGHPELAKDRARTGICFLTTIVAVRASSFRTEVLQDDAGVCGFVQTDPQTGGSTTCTICHRGVDFQPLSRRTL
jgi:hypothetical protein